MHMFRVKQNPKIRRNGLKSCANNLKSDQYIKMEITKNSRIRGCENNVILLKK
jgi:hypothetical protein